MSMIARDTYNDEDLDGFTIVTDELRPVEYDEYEADPARRSGALAELMAEYHRARNQVWS